VPTPSPLSLSGRILVLSVAFLGWLCAGLHMAITQLTGQPAAIDLLARSGELNESRYHALIKEARTASLAEADQQQLERDKAVVGQWFAWAQCSFLFGAAAGGFVFGRLGDRMGRSKAMAASIVTYSALAAAASMAQTPGQFCALWFLACTGVGGIWPNGVALVSEAWSSVSRPALAGVIGTAANIGLFLMNTIAAQIAITPDDWRWAPLVGATPLVLGIFAFFFVPESPRWLAAREAAGAEREAGAREPSVFRPPLLRVTLVAILLATIPIIGGWGTSNWMNPWADEAGAALQPPDLRLKARMGQVRALIGILGSFLGGWIASRVGRRPTYFLVSLASLAFAQYIFWRLVPTDPSFMFWVGALGFVSGIYFGWLPLCLPELFPTRVRSTGAGVGFNFGRIVTAVLLFAAGALMQFFAGDYVQIGRLTSLLFILGMVGIWFVPDTGAKQLED
jgi:SHS family sialic acid transporter-like MFS transporter